MDWITVSVSLYLMDQSQVSNQANNVSGAKKITIFKTIDLQNLETFQMLITSLINLLQIQIRDFGNL